jgi:hypothetical protein
LNSPQGLSLFVQEAKINSSELRLSVHGPKNQLLGLIALPLTHMVGVAGPAGEAAAPSLGGQLGAPAGFGGIIPSNSAAGGAEGFHEGLQLDRQLFDLVLPKKEAVGGRIVIDIALVCGY